MLPDQTWSNLGPSAAEIPDNLEDRSPITPAAALLANCDSPTSVLLHAAGISPGSTFISVLMYCILLRKGMFVLISAVCRPFHIVIHCCSCSSVLRVVNVYIKPHLMCTCSVPCMYVQDVASAVSLHAYMHMQDVECNVFLHALSPCNHSQTDFM